MLQLSLFFLIILGLGSASACPFFQTTDANGNCVCAVGGNPPDANGNCPIPDLCFGTGTCSACPQGQIQLSNGTCLVDNPTLAQIIASDGLCPAPEQLSPTFSTCYYPLDAPGYGTACTLAPPLPSSSPPYSLSSGACCPPGQIPATLTFQYPGLPPVLIYSGTCCPAGQVPLKNGTCTPKEPFITGCSGNAPFNPRTNSCCPPGSSISNHYQCCAAGLAPQPNGTCGCPWTAATNSDGSCTRLCPPNYIPSPPTTGLCSNCPPGQTELAGCCPQNLPGATCIKCPSGEVGTSQGTCCLPDRVASGGFCCPSGYHTAQNGFCVSNTSKQSTERNACKPDETRLDDGTCAVMPPVELPVLVPACTGDDVRGPDGTCTPKMPPQEHPCPPGLVPGPHGTCVLAACPPDQTMVDRRCSVLLPACPPGQTRLDDGKCGVKQPVETPELPVEVPGRSDNPEQCANGLVPREAFRGDRVCVPTWVRDQAVEDNNAAPSRVDPEGGCVKGYVWREAKPGDHVCVTPPTRARTRSDNRNAISQPLQPPDSTRQQIPPGEFVPGVFPPSNCRGKCVTADARLWSGRRGPLRPVGLARAPSHRVS